MPQIIIKLGDNVVQNYTFDKAILNIGRSRDNDIVLDNLAVSRNHCRIRLVDGKFLLTDLNSANGTFVNGVRITKAEVMDEDIISVGKHKLIFKAQAVAHEEEIGEAFTTDRTMIVDNSAEGLMTVTKGKNKGERFKLSKYETTIGRASENDIVLNDWFVSKVHAKIIKQGKNFILRDLGSWKGTYINDKLVKEPLSLRENDEVRIGSTKLVFGLFDENKMLQVEGRRPEELGYSPMAGYTPDSEIGEEPPDVGMPSPPPIPAAAPAASPVGGVASRSAFGMRSNDSKDEELNFDELPEPEQFEALQPSAHRPKEVLEPTVQFTSSANNPRPATSAEMYRNDGLGSNPFAPRTISTQDRPAVNVPKTPALVPTPAAAPPPASSQPAAADAPHHRVPQPEDRPLRQGVTWRDYEGMAAVAQAAKASAAINGNVAEAPRAPAAVPAAVDSGGAGGDDKMVKVWERALNNKDPLIRKQAVKMLKKLTGRDYEVS